MSIDSPICDCGTPRVIEVATPFRRYERWKIVHCPRCTPGDNRRRGESVNAWARRIMTNPSALRAPRPTGRPRVGA